MELHTIDTGLFKLDGGAMHGVVPKSLWEKKNPADEANLCSWAMRCMLVVIGQRRILIDTGIGNKQDEKFFSHYHLHGTASLQGSLAAKGLAPEDITDVFLTHLHFDHVGGAVIRSGDRLRTAFPNATYWSNRAHWQWATEPNAREKASFLKDNILPILESGQLQYIDTPDGEEWLPGFRIHYVNGHTDAMMLPLLDYKGERILYCADLLPSIAHIPLPWIMGYDTRPLLTLDEKTKHLQAAAINGYKLYFEHDAVNEMATVVQTDRGVRADQIMKLSDL